MPLKGEWSSRIPPSVRFHVNWSQGTLSHPVVFFLEPEKLFLLVEGVGVLLLVDVFFVLTGTKTLSWLVCVAKEGHRRRESRQQRCNCLLAIGWIHSNCMGLSDSSIKTLEVRQTIHPYIYISVNPCIHTSMPPCIHASIHPCLYAPIHPHIHAYIHASTDPC